MVVSLSVVPDTYEERYDASMISSRNWDFGPTVGLSKEMAASQGRRLVVESAFPFSLLSGPRRGVPGTKWVHIDKTFAKPARTGPISPLDLTVRRLFSAPAGKP